MHLKSAKVWICLLASAFCYAQAEESQSVKVSGDLRYRYQNLKSGDNEADPTQAMRARVTVEGTVNEEAKAIVQFGTFGGGRDTSSATGAFSKTNNKSSNQPMGANAGSEKWSSAITQAQIVYTSQTLEGLKLAIGKMANPMYYAGKSQIVFDTDIYLEGLFGSYTYQLAEGHSLFFNHGNFIVQSLYNPTATPEQEDIADDYTTATQLGWKGEFGGLKMGAALGQTRFPTGSLVSLNELQFEIGGAMTEEGSWNAYLHHATNSKADDDNKARVIGVDLKYGRIKLGLASIRNEAKSVSGTYSDGDVGGPDKSSNILKLATELGKNLELGITQFNTKTALDPAAGANVDQSRTQIDLVAKF